MRRPKYDALPLVECRYCGAVMLPTIKSKSPRKPGVWAFYECPRCHATSAHTDVTNRIQAYDYFAARAAFRFGPPKPWQEPLTLDEAMQIKGGLILETHRKCDDHDQLYYVKIEHKKKAIAGAVAIRMMNQGTLNRTDYFDLSGYNGYWRCWRTIPTINDLGYTPWRHGGKNEREISGKAENF